VAKGLDESGNTAMEVFQDALDQHNEFALLYGPMIAEELCAGRYGFALAACSAPAFERIHRLFGGSRLLLSHTTDLRGASWAVILKNVYAIGFGIVDGLEMGDNVRGFLMVQALAELSRIVKAMGGDPRTCCELPGLGDLTTTATSPDSHHYALGARLARGVADKITGEGVHTLAMVENHGLLETARYPLMETIRDIVRDPGSARARMDAYLAACFPGPR
jgi:glycerol-3-phosphate dehydrogenase (NAD(P)+)